MKTLIAPNYAKDMLIQGQFRTELLRDHFQKTGLSPLVRLRFTDDMFSIWAGNKDSLDHFIFSHRITVNPKT